MRTLASGVYTTCSSANGYGNERRLFKGLPARRRGCLCHETERWRRVQACMDQSCVELVVGMNEDVQRLDAASIYSGQKVLAVLKNHRRQCKRFYNSTNGRQLSAWFQMVG